MTARRRFLLGLTSAALPLLLQSPRARAMHRVPYGGTLRLTIPSSLRAIDPHDPFDLDAALLTSALFDPLYALDGRGQPYPALADGLPENDGSGLRISLRPGLRTGAGHPLDGRDVEFSLKRAAARGARILLQPLGSPRLVRGRSNAVVFAQGDPQGLARALASPLTALVPRGFVPQRPDGTGPFAFSARPGTAWTLRRNPWAARGGGFLDSIVVRSSPDLAAALRAFEADEADVGWLASGLHRARHQATRLDAGPLGWVVLCTGRQLGPWSAVGVAQSVLDAANLGSLVALGLKVPSPSKATPDVWRGPPADLLVDSENPQLLAIARALAEALGGTHSGLRVTPATQTQLAAKKASGDYALLLDFIRKLGPGPADDIIALRTGAALTSTGTTANLTGTPLPGRGSLRETARLLRLGVVGELRLQGAHSGRFVGLDRWRLGDVFEAGDKPPA